MEIIDTVDALALRRQLLLPRAEWKRRMETSTSEEQDTVLDIFSRHYNAHPLIPDQNGTYQYAEYIHCVCCGNVSLV